MPEDQPPVLTPAALERLRDELDELSTKGRRDISERLLRARELGDISENAEYDQTKNDQAMLEARIRQLQWMIKHAVVQEAPATTKKVVPGTIVHLRPADDPSDVEVYLFAASKEERASGARTITPSAPLGAALLGKKPGDKVSYQAPGGKFSYQIVEIAPWDGS